MAFRDFSTFNSALLGKQVRRIFTHPNLLVSKFLKSMYYTCTSIINSTASPSFSYLWKSLVFAFSLVSNGSRYVVGNGRKIRIWKDAWFPIPITFEAQTKKPLACAFIYVLNCCLVITTTGILLC
ncbi:hypothetical protein ACH5RR_001216 [Cinchona calisaya]|uniref:Uncharacterized protein n=1 Tax=Cinchona calisaya TaxID=153742 RepID=A0ABD3B2U7_9GENT